jgi:hypothetical protein
MIVEKQMECRLARETEVLGKNLPQSHFCSSQNPTLPNPGRRGGKPATKRLSYGVAFSQPVTGIAFTFLLNCEQYFFFIFLVSIRINCNRISEGLLCLQHASALSVLVDFGL